MMAGSIPVYLGAGDIDAYVPSDCFIDARKIKDTKTLCSTLLMMKPESVQCIRKNIFDYLSSEKSDLFRVEQEARRIIAGLLYKE